VDHATLPCVALHLGVGAVVPHVQDVFRVGDVALLVPGQGAEYRENGVIPSAAFRMHRCGNPEGMTGKGFAVERADRRDQSEDESIAENKIYWRIGPSLTEPSSGFGMTSTAAFSVSNHRLP
jgi:hypothetical protein